MAGDALKLRLTCTRRGVCRVEFVREREPTPRNVSFRFVGSGRHSMEKELWRDSSRQLKQYLCGKRRRFRIPLDLCAGTPFQRKVWRALRRIPYGQTRSYAWVARQIGCPRAARAVGAACAANPVPILVPCHRVVRSDGSLGGFSAGLAWKRALLRLEQAGIRPAPSA